MNLLIYFWGFNFAFGAEICFIEHGSLSKCMLRALFMCILLIFC
jgi:hypothetical protein